MTVKQLLAGLVLCIGISQLPAKELKVLTIGNSSSFSVGKNLPMIVHSFPDHKLELTSAYINGCTFEKHVANIKLAEADRKKGIYTVAVRNSASPTRPVEFKASLVELLKNQKYDIITIQQASTKSWEWDSYEPFAGELIRYIRKVQPKAEIVIQQTWAFRADAPHFRKPTFGQADMYEKLCEANRKLAEKYRLRVIPMGDAVQLFRESSPVKYQIPEEKMAYPNLPSSEGDAVGASLWRKDPKSGENILLNDYRGLNLDGQYMQGCLWFGFLYDEPVEKIKYAPKGMDKEKVALLKECAERALSGWKQVK